MSGVEKEFEEFFESGKLILQMTLVPSKTDVELLIKGWMEQAYLAGRQKGEEERGRLRGACRAALRFGTFHEVNEEQQAKKLIMKAIEP